jgi:2-oxoglutarate ferredoxin oxidoreductase subunit gamma
MTERLIISGFGGQGIMFLGKIIALAAMGDGKYVTFLPAYGAEVRGGTSHCAVIISDKEIASPAATQIDTLIAMNEPSVVKFISRLRKGADIFINGSMAQMPRNIEGLKVHYIRFSDIAAKLGSVKMANMVAFGAYLSRKKVLSVKNIIKILPEVFKTGPKLVRLNEQAIKAGIREII